MAFQYRPFDPPAELDLILRSSFVARGRIPYRTDKILPTGLIPVLFNLGHPHRLGKSPNADENPSFAHGWVEGFQTTPNYHTPTNGTHVVGLLFEPIGFHALFGVDMVEIRDRTAAVREVLPSSFVATVEALLHDASTETGHASIWDALLALPRRPGPTWLSEIYREIRDRRGSVELADCYERHDVNPRQVTAAFTRAVGVTPKKLCRVHRLLALLEAIDPATPVNWTELAHAFGFYDQAHFNHEFRSLAGLPPGDYLEQRRRGLPDLGKGESVPFVPTR